MMLSGDDLRRAISNKSLRIEPFNPECIRPAGITLLLGDTLLKPIPGKVVDVKKNIIPDYTEIKITEANPYELGMGEFILGATFELVSVGPNLGFFIEGRSTLARVGLTIVQTAMIVYPGHKDRAITLELANHGPNAIRLYPKMKIARAAVFELKTPSTEEYDTDGKYRDQEGVGRPIFKKEILS